MDCAYVHFTLGIRGHGLPWDLTINGLQKHGVRIWTSKEGSPREAWRSRCTRLQ